MHSPIRLFSFDFSFGERTLGSTYCHTAPLSALHTPHLLHSDGCLDCGHIVRTKRELKGGSVLAEVKQEKGQLLVHGAGCYCK